MARGSSGSAHRLMPLLVSLLLLPITVLASCGAASASTGTATTTPNCARTPRIPQSVTGTINTVTATSFQLTDTAGKVISVQITNTTRITRVVAASATSITAGMTVQVTADASGTAAQRIVLAPQSGSGLGSRTGRAGGTPPAGVNAACAATRTSNRGAFQGNQQGIRGTVASASSTQVVVTDPRGQTLTFAITPATQILTTTTGAPGDLVQGSTVIVTGALSGATLTARAIVVQTKAAG